MLWCPGIGRHSQLFSNFVAAGSGKSILSYYHIKKDAEFSSLVIDHLQRTAQSTSAIVYVYFNYNEQKTQSVTNVAADILKQLVSQFDDVPQDIVDLLNDMRSKSRHLPDAKIIIELIHEIAARFSVFYLILDALDECDYFSVRPKWLEFINRLESWGTRAFITCRPHAMPDGDTFERLEVRAHVEDISIYVRAKLASATINSRLKEEIVATLLLSAKGTFVA